VPCRSGLQACILEKTAGYFSIPVELPGQSGPSVLSKATCMKPSNSLACACNLDLPAGARFFTPNPLLKFKKRRYNGKGYLLEATII